MYNLQERLWAEKKKILSKELAMLLIRLNMIKVGDFTLTSGKRSPYYIDLRVLPSYPSVMDKIADMYIEVIRNEISDKQVKLAAVPTAGLPLATAVSLKAKLPLIYVRETPKLHGHMKLIEGILEQGEEAVLLDDLVTTGGSLLRAAEAVRNSGGCVKHAVVLIDREEGGFGNLAQAGIALHYITKITDVFEWIGEASVLSKGELKRIIEYLEGHGEGELQRA